MMLAVACVAAPEAQAADENAGVWSAIVTPTAKTGPSRLGGKQPGKKQARRQAAKTPAKAASDALESGAAHDEAAIGKPAQPASKKHVAPVKRRAPTAVDDGATAELKPDADAEAIGHDQPVAAEDAHVEAEGKPVVAPETTEPAAAVDAAPAAVEEHAKAAGGELGAADAHAAPAAHAVTAEAPAPAAKAQPAHGDATAKPATQADTTPAQPAHASEPAAGTHEPAAKGNSAAFQKQVQSYCVNITNFAMDARFLNQKKQLEQVKVDLEKRTAELEGKIKDFKDWLARRDEFASKARDSLVSIYASMKAEAAAKQLTELDEESASSVLAKLDPRQSSTIMSEMEPKKAARLMEIIAGASKLPDKPAPATAVEGNVEASPQDAVAADPGAAAEPQSGALEPTRASEP
ncbi:MAG: MotE family protein [Hyphomicrobium sp.]